MARRKGNSLQYAWVCSFFVFGLMLGLLRPWDTVQAKKTLDEKDNVNGVAEQAQVDQALWEWDDLPQDFRNKVHFTDPSFQERLLQYFGEKAIERTQNFSEEGVLEPLEGGLTPTINVLKILTEPDQLNYLEIANLVHDYAIEKSYLEEGSKTLRELYNEYKSYMDKENRMEFRLLEADLLMFSRNFIESSEMFQEIISVTRNEEQEARALSQLGYIKGETGQFEEAASYLFAAAEIFRALEETDKLGVTYNRIGLLYSSMENYETAEQYQQKYIDIAEARGDSTWMLDAYSNMGVLKKESKQYEDAIRYYELAYNIAEQLQLPGHLARVLLNIGNVYNSQGKHQDALNYYSESLVICEQIDLSYGVMLNQLNIGQVYFQIGEYQLSEQNLLFAYEYLKERNMQRDLSNVVKYLYEVYNHLGQFQTSNAFIEEYLALQAELYDIEKTTLTEDLRFRYETDLKDQQILLAEAEVQKNRATNRALSMISLLIVFLMGGTVVYLKQRNGFLRTLYERNVEILDTMGLDEWNLKEKEDAIPLENKETQRNRELFKKISKTILKHELYKDPDLQISKLSKLLNTNERYLSMAITSMSGMYYNQYINHFRIQEAKRMILQGATVISEIQSACGFNASSTFYNAFKKSTGMTPMQFMDQNRQAK